MTCMEQRPRTRVHNALYAASCFGNGVSGPFTVLGMQNGEIR